MIDCAERIRENGTEGKKGLPGEGIGFLALRNGTGMSSVSNMPFFFFFFFFAYYLQTRDASSLASDFTFPGVPGIWNIDM